MSGDRFLFLENWVLAHCLKQLGWPHLPRQTGVCAETEPAFGRCLSPVSTVWLRCFASLLCSCPSCLCSASDSHPSTWPPTSFLSLPQTDEATARRHWEAEAGGWSFHASLLGSRTREESQWVCAFAGSSEAGCVVSLSLVTRAPHALDPSHLPVQTCRPGRSRSLWAFHSRCIPWPTSLQRPALARCSTRCSCARSSPWRPWPPPSYVTRPSSADGRCLLYADRL